MIYEYTITTVRQVKRNIFIRLIGARTAVFIPDIHALSVLGKRGEALSHTIDKLAYGKSEFLAHVSICSALIISKAIPVCLHECKISAAALCDDFSVSLIGHAPVFFCDDKRKASALDTDLLLILCHIQIHVFFYI